METRFGSLVLGLLVLASLSISCKADEEETYIPLVTNLWTETTRPTHAFTFRAHQTGVSKGTFDGNESESGIVVSDSLFGTFSDRNIAFTVRKGVRDTVYNGRFVADAVIDLGRFKISHN